MSSFSTPTSEPTPTRLEKTLGETSINWSQPAPALALAGAVRRAAARGGGKSVALFEHDGDFKL